MRLLVVLYLSLCVILAPSMASAQSELVVDRIMARVGDTIITRSELVSILPIYLQVAARVDPSSLRTREGQEQVAKEMLEYMIDTRLVVDRAKQDDMALTDGELEQYLRNYRESMGLNASQFRQALAQEGMDFDDYREFMRGYLTRMQMIRSGAAGDVSVLEEEVDAVLRERYPDGYRQPYFTTSHILVTVPQGAPQSLVDDAYATLQGVRAQILAGDLAFGDAALDYNSDATRYRDGEVGTFTLGDLDPDYTRAALGLEVGEISEPVRSQFGLHLVRLDAIEVREIEDMDGLRNRIRYEIREEKTARAQDVYFRRLRDSNFVQILSTDFGL